MHFARECRSKGNQDSRRRDAWNTGNKDKDNGRGSGKQEESKALVTLDGEGVDWTSHSEDEQENYALMAYNNSGSDTKVTSCSKECKESYVKLKKLYDEQREQLGDAILRFVRESTLRFVVLYSTTVLRSVVFGVAFWSLGFALAFWLLKVAFCLLEDLIAFCLKISLRFASRPHCVLLQDNHCVLLEDLTAFCFKTSLRFASRPHCVLLQVITAFCFNITAFYFKTSLRFASSYHCVLLQYHCVAQDLIACLLEDHNAFFDRNNSDDIQAASSDTRPPMLDRTDYESWLQQIRLYCRGKENGLQILQSIDQGPFELGTTRDALGTTPEGGYELIKEDKESQLYNEFERFKMLPGENINEYYVRFP
ncbi:hypothetical protein Tco_0367889 [Tanacetum coccineum]